MVYIMAWFSLHAQTVISVGLRNRPLAQQHLLLMYCKYSLYENNIYHAFLF